MPSTMILMEALREPSFGRVVPKALMPSGNQYTLDSQGRILVEFQDIETLGELGFQVVGYSGVGSTPGARGMEGLVDVEVTNIQSGDVLVFDATDGHWKNSPITPSSFQVGPGLHIDTGTNPATLDVAMPLPGTYLPQPQLAILGGVLAATAPADQFMIGINLTGAPQFAQPSFSNLSGVISPLQISLTDGHIFVGNSSNNPADVALSGDVTITDTGAATVITATNAVLGKSRPDNSTITITGGVLSAVSGTAGINQLTGDVTAGPGVGSQVATLATVNSNVGTFQGITVNAKGLVTAAVDQHYPTGPATWAVGSVAFATSTTGLGQDNANLFFDDSNNFLGIGTGSPSQRLHVAGNIYLQAGDIHLDNTRIIYAKNTSGVLKQVLFGRWSDNATYLDGGTGGTFLRTNDGVVNNIYLATTGKVGISGTNTDSNLHVTSADASSTGYARFTTSDYVSGSVGSGLFFHSGANSGNTYSGIGALSAGFSAWNNLILQYGGGRVGIGTTSPQTGLDVAGNHISGVGNISGSANNSAYTIWGGGPSGTDGGYIQLWGSTSAGAGQNILGGTTIFFSINGIGDRGRVNSTYMIAGVPGSGSEISFSNSTDPSTGAWIRSDGSNTVISTNVGDIYLGYGGSAKNIRFHSQTNQLGIWDSNGYLTVGSLGLISRILATGAGGQTSLSFSTAGSLTDVIELDSQGISSGNGGAILFSAASTGWKFAAIKGYVRDGGGNSRGDISFLVRPVNTDSTLTEVMRVDMIGQIWGFNSYIAVANGPGGNHGMYRMVPNGSGTLYGSFWYNDGSTTYLLLTANNDAFGVYNSLRPFAVNDATGYVTMGHGLQVNSGIDTYYSTTNVGLNVFNGAGGGSVLRIYDDGNSHIESTTGLHISYATGVPVSIYGHTNIYKAGANDPLQVEVDNGHYARCLFLVDSTRQWSAGVNPSGEYVVADETGGQFYLKVDTSGIVHAVNGSFDTHGANAGYFLDDRTGTSPTTWAWYATSGLVRLWNNVNNDRITVDTSGIVTFTNYLAVPNLVSYTCKDTGGTARGAVTMAASNELLISDNLRNIKMQGPIMPITDNTWFCGTAGLAWSNVNSYGYTTSSDRKYKKEIGNLPNCLDLVNKLRPQKYKLNDETDEVAEHYGFVAQDLEAAMGESGHKFGAFVPNEDGHGIAYNELVAVLWKACQEMSSRIETLEAKVH